MNHFESIEPARLEGVGITLNQVLALDRRTCLYGHRIADLHPLGDLGLGLDPEGPVGFALVRAYRFDGRFVVLGERVILSVFGEGRPPRPDDADAQSNERLWSAAAGDRALRLAIHHGTLQSLLDPARHV